MPRGDRPGTSHGDMLLARVRGMAGQSEKACVMGVACGFALHVHLTCTCAETSAVSRVSVCSHSLDETRLLASRRPVSARRNSRLVGMKINTLNDSSHLSSAQTQDTLDCRLDAATHE